MSHTDIVVGRWFERILPKAALPYIYLMRLDRPVGYMLLLWPCLFSLTLASYGVPSFKLFMLFVIGSIVMRGAGCVINDLWDRKIDKAVERTAVRPLPSGQVSIAQAVAFLVFLLTIGVIILAQFNAYTIILGLCSTPLIVLYPLAKRITWWPQLVLGLTFNWGALLGWSAVHGSVGVPAFLLYIGCIFWTLAYDTIYAHQDKQDDKKVGIKSLALYLGDRSRPWIAIFYALFFFFLIIAAVIADIHDAFYYALFTAQLYTIWKLCTWRIDEPAHCLERFKDNSNLGSIIFLSFLIGKSL